MDHRLKQSVQNFKGAASVGARLRRIREGENYSQENVAFELMVSRENYANFELGRTPIKVTEALAFCNHFVVSEMWLATGKGPLWAFMNLASDPVCSEVEAQTSFLSAVPVNLLSFW